MFKTLIPVAFAFVLYALMPYSANAQQKVILSPNGKVSVTLNTDNNFAFAVRLKNIAAFTISDASLVVRDHEMGKVSSVKRRSVNEVQHPLVREKRAIVTDKFNEIMVTCKSKSGILLRVYDDGIAYRFFTRFNEDSVVILNETATLQFTGKDSLYLPIIHCREEKGVDCFHTSFEEDYVHKAAGQIAADQLAYLPVYARTGNGISLSVTESDLHDYPGMNVSGSEDVPNSLKMRFPAFCPAVWTALYIYGCRLV